MRRKKVYGLKRATPGMKHVHMNQVMQEKSIFEAEQDKEAERKRLERAVEEINAENDAIRRCVALEGEQSFYRWWDDDEQVPPYGPRRERIELIEQRIRKHEGSVADEKEPGTKSQQEAAS